MTPPQGRLMIGAPEIILFGILFGAFFVGTVLGFGTSIITVTFAVQVMPLEQILPVIAPLNVCLSLYLVIRHHRSILWHQLLRRILPAVGVGVPFGLLLFNLRDARWLRLAFGAFVTLIAAAQLRVSLGAKREPQAPLRGLPGLAMLSLGGVVHGLFNTGGPLIVYVLGREIEDKGEFRSTLAALFSVLTLVLVIDYVAIGLVTVDTVKLSLLGGIPVLAGLGLGEIAHDRLDSKSFKLALWVLLCIGGVILTVRAAS